MDNRVNYFGYGAMAYPSVMEALLGRALVRCWQDARLDNYKLVAQHLNQVPDQILRGAPTAECPRAMLKKVWPANFRSYTIIAARGSSVMGRVWQISPQERNLIFEYELGPWGWMRAINDVWARSSGGGLYQCTTEGLGPGQQYDPDFMVIDSDVMPPLLAHPYKTLEVAKRVGEEFRARTW